MSGFVYLIGPEAVFHRSEWDLRVVKIGYTRHHPNGRLNELAGGSPVALELIAFMPGGLELERAFHETFAPLRSHREWFYLQGKLFDFVSYLYSPPAPHAAVERDRLITAMIDTVFARGSSHPSMSDQEYMASARPHHLASYFPEVFA